MDAAQGDLVKHLKEIFQELGVGINGFVTLDELSTVCDHIGMEKMNDEELQQLFVKLDLDRDGRISFDEFLSGLFSNESPNPETQNKPPPLASSHEKKLRLPSTNNCISVPSGFGSGMLDILDSDGTGYIDAEVITELWETFGITDGLLVLEFLQFDVDSRINLSELSSVLEQELHSHTDNDSTMYQLAVETVLHVLSHLQSTMKDMKIERDRMVQELKESRHRISELAEEADDVYAAMERQKNEQISYLKDKNAERLQGLQRDQDGKVSRNTSFEKKLEDDLVRTKRECHSLKETISSLEEKNEHLKMTINDLTKRAADLEEKNRKLKIDLHSTTETYHQLREARLSNTGRGISSEDERLALLDENKSLKDEVDELQIKLEQLMSNRKKLLSIDSGERCDWSEAELRQHYENEMRRMQNGMSVERKDVEENFRLEISEIEQRHHDELERLKKEFVHEKEELLALHQRHLVDALAEQERDLLTEFCKDRAELRGSSSEIGKLPKAEEDLRIKELLMKELEDKILSVEADIQESKTASEQIHHGAVKKMEEEFDLEMEKQRKDLLDQFGRKLTALQELHDESSSSSYSFNDEEIIKYKMHIEQLDREMADRDRETQDLSRIQSSTPKRHQFTSTSLASRDGESANVESSATKRHQFTSTSLGGGDDEAFLQMQIDELCKVNVSLEDDNMAVELNRMKRDLDECRRMLNEQNRMQSLANTPPVAVNNKLNEQSSHPEVEILKHQLRLTVNQLNEVTSTLSFATNQHSKEREAWSLRAGQVVELSKFQQLSNRLMEAETLIKRLQGTLENKSSETARILSATQKGHERESQKLLTKVERLEDELRRLRTCLDDQTALMNRQGEQMGSSEVLVKDLYVENANLVKCLQLTERHRRDSNSRVLNLEQKCAALQRLLHMICPAALS